MTRPEEMSKEALLKAYKQLQKAELQNRKTMIQQELEYNELFRKYQNLEQQNEELELKLADCESF